MQDKLNVSKATKDELIARSVMDSIWEWHIEENEITLPPFLQRLLGAREYKTMKFDDLTTNLIHPEDIEELENRVCEYLNKNVNSFCAEFRVKTKYRIYRWMRISGEAQWDNQGNALYMAGTCTDITDIKIGNENAEKFKNIFNNVNDMILLVKINADRSPGRILEGNNMLCKALGYTRRDLLKLTLLDLKSSHDYNDMNDKISIFLKEKKWTMETDIMRKDGTIIPVEINGHITTINGEQALLAVLRDTTERKKVENELIDLMKEKENLYLKALEYDKLKTDFFSNMSHELRTPLNIILGSLQLLDTVGNKIEENNDRNHKLCPYRVPKYMGFMKQNCYRLLRLINNIIDLNKVDTGFLTMNLKNCNIVDVVEDIAMSVIPYVESKGITLTFDTDVEEKIMACDLDKIERIILNLIANAVKFTSKDGKIEVIVGDMGSTIIVKVRDNGMGIPADKIGELFQRFRQIDAHAGKNIQGSGIGLSLVKALVEAHGGTVGVESTYGVGSEFIIELPAERIVEKGELKNQYMSKPTNVERINIEFSDIYDK